MKGADVSNSKQQQLEHTAETVHVPACPVHRQQIIEAESTCK